MTVWQAQTQFGGGGSLSARMRTAGDRKTSDEVAAAVLSGSELIRGVQSGSDVKISIDDIAQFVGSEEFQNSLTIANAQASTFAPEVQILQIFGAQNVGDGGQGTFIKNAIQPAHDCWFQSVDGAYWVPTTNGLTLNVRANNAVLDGAADDSTTIQEVIDACIYYSLAPETFIPIGTAKITKTIHVGYGSTAFKCGRLRGAGTAYFETGPGSTIDASSFVNAPAVNIQGARFSWVKGIYVKGEMRDYIINGSFGSKDNEPAFDDTDAANWISPTALASNANVASSTAPYCGIAIDAYLGAQPSPNYPSVSYPSFVSSGQYNKNPSSRVDIEDFIIAGFTVGCVDQPSGGDSQGEYVCFRRGTISQCAYGVAIGEFNARQSRLQDINFFQVHTAFTNENFGAGHGHLTNEIVNCDLNKVIQLCDIAPTPTTGGMKFTSCYSELMWRIGFIIGSQISVTFDNCWFKFDLQASGSSNTYSDNNTPQRGVPECLLDTQGQALDVKFIGGQLRQFWSVAMINAPAASVSMDRTHIAAANVDRNWLYEKYASNATMGGICFGDMMTSRNTNINVSYSNFDAGTGGAGITTGAIGDFWVGARGYPTPLWCRYHSPINHRRNYNSSPYGTLPDLAEVPARHNNLSLGAANYTSYLTYTPSAGVILVMTFVVTPDAAFGPRPGDILRASNNYSIFFVRSISPDGLTVTAVLQNNFHANAWNAWVPISSITVNSGANGNWLCCSTRFYTPDQALWGDLTNGSNVIANVISGVDDEGISVSTGDYIFFDRDSDDVMAAPSYSLVTNVDQGANSITVSDNLTKTRVHVRLANFVLPGPALEAGAWDPLVYGALVWLDIQDLTSLYRNRATAPVTTNNLFYQSNSLLTNTNVNAIRGWAFDNLTGSFPTQNATGPGGESNYAWSLVCSGSDVADWLQVVSSQVATTTYTYQAKVKSSSASCWIAAFSSASGNDPVFVDCKNGAIGHTPAGITANISASTGGFFLLTLTAAGMGTFFAIVAGNNNYAAPTAGTTLIICDQMFETGGSATTYSADANATGASLYATAAVGQAVGAVVNKGTAGGVWIAPSDAQRPFLRSTTVGSDTRYYLDFSVNSGNAYLVAPSDVTLTSTALSCAAVVRPAAAANTVVFGAAATATPHTLRWATTNHLITSLGDTALDDGTSHAATGNHLLTDRRTSDSPAVQFIRLDKAAITSGAASATITNKIRRLGNHNGTNSTGGVFSAAIFSADLSANVSNVEDYFGAIIGI